MNRIAIVTRGQLILASSLCLVLGCHGVGMVDVGYSDPELSVPGEEIATSYPEEAGWYLSPVLEAPTGTTRAALLLELVPGMDAAALRIEARGIHADGSEGDWLPVDELFQDEDFLTGHADLGFEAAGLRLRISANQADAIAILNLAAANPELAAALDGVDDDQPTGLGSQEQWLTSTQQSALGSRYRSRSAWGASAARSCSADGSKYRMAIHHTAGGSSISDAAIRSIQRWHQVDRGWCDIGYHYLVDRNGTVYQGRLISRLGTHTGSNNSGNIGISLIGCYDSRESECGPVNRSTGSSAVPSAALIESAGRLIGVLARSNGITIDRNRIRGHGEHSGTSSTCPGNNVLSRFETILGFARSPDSPSQPQPEPRRECERDDLLFSDIGCSPHMNDILWMASEGLTGGCGGGKFCPDQPVTRAQTAVFLQRAFDLPPGPAVFSDLAGNPHADAIHAVAAAGITGGCGGGKFCPNDNVTRGQMATFLARALNLPEVTGWLSDVAQSSPHAAGIYSVMAVGISGGCATDKFCPDAIVSRGQIATFMRKAVEYMDGNCHSPSSVFIDIGCSLFKEDIEWIAAEGITSGCGGLRYCPDNTVTRAQMATFLARALGLPPGPPIFSDVSGNPHEESINAIAAAGITSGCGGGRYCPDSPLTRAQMATFLARAYDLPPGPAIFSDVAGNPHADAIHAIAAAGITSGCGGGRYCPDDQLNRGQMARFLHRASR